MTLDLTKPLQTTDGREAKYLGELPDGSPIFTWRGFKTDSWQVCKHAKEDIDHLFENTTPAPPKLWGFCPVMPDGTLGRVFEEVAYTEPSRDWIDLSTLTERNFLRVRG